MSFFDTLGESWQVTLEFGSRLTGTELNHLKASDPDATGDTIWALEKRNRQPAGRYCPDVDGLCDRERLFLSPAPNQRLIPALQLLPLQQLDPGKQLQMNALGRQNQCG